MKRSTATLLPALTSIAVGKASAAYQPDEMGSEEITNLYISDIATTQPAQVLLVAYNGEGLSEIIAAANLSPAIDSDSVSPSSVVFPVSSSTLNEYRESPLELMVTTESGSGEIAVEERIMVAESTLDQTQAPGFSARETSSKGGTTTELPSCDSLSKASPGVNCTEATTTTTTESTELPSCDSLTSGANPGVNCTGITLPDGSGTITEEEIETINTQVEEEATTLEQTLQDPTSLTPAEVVTALASTENLMGSLATLADSGATFTPEDHDKVREVMGGISNTVTSAISQNATPAELAQLAASIVNSVGSVDNILAKVADASSQVDFFTKTGELIDAGIDAISSGYANDAAGQKTQITALVGNLGESATAALSQLTAATTEDFSNVLKSSAETFSKAVSSSTENNLSAEVLSQLGQDLSSEVPTLFDDTTAYLTASTTVDRADAKEITNGISSLSNAILDTGTPLNAEVVTKNQAFADTSITRSISAIAEGHALSIDAADIQQQDRVQEFLRDNPLVLQDVLAESIPRLTASIGIGQAARSTNIATSLGVDEATASGLADSLPAAVDSQQAITTTTNSDGSTTTVSAFSALSSAALDSFTGSSSNELTVDPASGAVKISATASGTSLEGSTSSVFISDTYISSDLLPDGLHTLPDGSRVSVSAGVSNRLSPAPGDATSLLYTLENTLGLPSAISSDGQVAVDLGGVGTFTAGFDYQVNPDLSRAIASSSFSVIGTDPSSTGFSYLVNFESDDTTQLIPPSIAALTSVISVLDTLSLNYQIDRSSGVITVADSLQLKPDYLLTPLTAEQQSYLQQQPIITDVAIETDDYNGDSLSDFGIITPNGFQKLYTVSGL